MGFELELCCINVDADVWCDLDEAGVWMLSSIRLRFTRWVLGCENCPDLSSRMCASICHAAGSSVPFCEKVTGTRNSWGVPGRVGVLLCEEVYGL